MDTVEKVEGSTDNTLDALYKDRSVTLSDGNQVKLHKMKVRHIKSAIDLLRKVLVGIMEGSSPMAAKLAEGDFTMGDIVTPGKITPDTILQLISNNFDEAFTLAAFHVDLDKEQLLDLDLEDGILIIAGIVRINVDFFTRRLIPLIEQMAMEIAANIPQEPSVK